jgi:hypothetical protein
MTSRRKRARTSVIDPRRKRQNDALAARLLAFQDQLAEGMSELDPRAWLLVEKIHRKSKSRRATALQHPIEVISSQTTLAIADELRASSVGPLGRAIDRTSPIFIFDGDEYTPRQPLPWTGHNLLNVIAPLTWHVCTELLIALGNLTILLNDPSSGDPLSIERARYASQQTELIRIEHSLWQLAGQYGGPTQRIPYAYRAVLLFMAWQPAAHEADGGAWTLCIRCGELLHRSRPFESLPRCPACMKETTRQREWPEHAIAPHDRGTWLLRCQYASCDEVFIGPRHRKRCDAHMSSKLAPKQRQLSGN